MVEVKTVLAGVRAALDRMRDAGGVPKDERCVTLYVAYNLWYGIDGRDVLYHEVKRQNPEIGDIECARHLEDDTVLLATEKIEETSDDSHD